MANRWEFSDEKQVEPITYKLHWPGTILVLGHFIASTAFNYIIKRWDRFFGI
jgi:hypothetical protein